MIYNLRYGFATNSSSTHSLIFLPDDGVEKTQTTEHHEFGWQYFTAADELSRRNYTAALLYGSLCRLMGDNAYDVVEKYTGVRLDRTSQFMWADKGIDEGPSLPEVYIDHQSLLSLPRNWSGNGIHREFAQEFVDFMMQPGLAVLGGNDNEDSPHPLTYTGDPAYLPDLLGEGHDNLVARKEEGYWVLFDRDTGNKARFDWPTRTRAYSDRAPDKAMRPELVDVKITDYCTFGCAFCYQGSTEEGKHAPRDYMYSVASALGRLGVFEVALGGGEPTSHPDFLEILRYFRSSGVVPNFTTRNLAWLDRKDAVEIAGLIGAWAYSPSSLSDLARLELKLKKFGEKLPRGYGAEYVRRERVLHPTVHLVLGTMGELKFRKMLGACRKLRWPVTLLGYKTTGRGGQFSPKNYDWWLDASADSRATIGIDTVVAADYEEQILAAGIPSYLFTTKEGKFSMYLDAVQKKVGPSSFCPAEQMINIPNSGYGLEEAVLESFKGW